MSSLDSGLYSKMDGAMRRFGGCLNCDSCDSCDFGITLIAHFAVESQ